MGSIHKASLLLLSTTLLVGFSLSARAGDGRIEHWVSADEAVVDGEVQVHLFDFPHQAPDLEMKEGLEARRAPQVSGPLMANGEHWRPEDCDLLSVATWQGPDGPQNPEARLASAKLSLLGTVAKVEGGFWWGSPASMVTVEVEKWLRFEASGEPPETVRFLHRHARVVLEGKAFCSTGFRETSPVPGRSVLLMADRFLSDLAPPVLYVQEPGLFYEDHHGAASLPGERIEDAPPGWAEIRRRALAVKSQE